VALSPRAKGILFAQLNAFAGGTMMAAGKEVTAVLEPQKFIALMYMILVPVNTVWWLLTHYGVIGKAHADDEAHHQPMTGRGVGWLLGHTLASVLGIIGLWEGLALADSAVGSLMSRIEVVVAIILGMLFLSERFTRAHWLGFGLTIVGMVVVRWTSLSGDATAFTWLVLGAIAFGFAEYTGKVAVRYIPVPRLVLLRGWLMMLALTAVWWIRMPGWPVLPAAIWGWLVFSALMGPVLARNSYMLSLSYLPVSQVVLLNQTQVLYAAVVGFILRTELPAALFWAGAAAIVLGNVVLVLARERGRRAVAT
jgi:drug/metabolite transporter (DMT)-like permease